MAPPQTAAFPTPLDAYPPAADSILATLAERLHVDPFNGIATAIFVLAIIHTFVTARFAAWAHDVQHAHDERCHLKAVTRRYGYPDMPIWNTESGYLVYNPERVATPIRPGSDDVFAKVLTPDELAAYMVRAHIITAAAGLDRFYWYSWDILDMGLTRSFGKTSMIGATAYATMLDWLRGATISRCATENDKTWLCYLRRDGKDAYVNLECR